MAETKKGGGFHAFEQRVHEIEEEDRKEERKGKPTQADAPKQATPPERKEPPRK